VQAQETKDEHEGHDHGAETAATVSATPVKDEKDEHEGHNHPPETTGDLSAVRTVARELVCPCPSCAKQALDQCHKGCADGQKYRNVVAGLLEQGQSKDQIIQHFAKTYGQQMLGNPLPQGSGKWAATVPYLAVFLGLIPLVWVGRSMSKPRKRKKKMPVANPENDDPELTAALRDYDY
jgi:cytochrome c-type biogenesis protein CcmH/NrfF